VHVAGQIEFFCICVLEKRVEPIEPEVVVLDLLYQDLPDQVALESENLFTPYVLCCAL